LLTMFVNGTPSLSQIVSYNPLAQTIPGFFSPQTLSRNGSPYTLPATTSAGYTVTYNVITGPATISGDTLTLTGTGTVIVTGSEPGSGGYAPLLATATITSASPMSYNQWAASYPGLTQTAFGATPENDGVTNLLKYLADINPTVPMSPTDRAALPVEGIDTNFTPGVTYLTLTYRQYALAAGITVTPLLQTSPDLVNWTAVPSPPVSRQIGTDPNTGDPIIEVGVPALGAGQQFIRLKFTYQTP
jgi:hypothetical protein